MTYVILVNFIINCDIWILLASLRNVSIIGTGRKYLYNITESCAIFSRVAHISPYLHHHLIQSIQDYCDRVNLGDCQDMGYNFRDVQSYYVLRTSEINIPLVILSYGTSQSKSCGLTGQLAEDRI